MEELNSNTVVLLIYIAVCTSNGLAIFHFPTIMAKKKVDQGSKGVTPTKADPPLMVKFPELSPKTDLECRVLLEDQILLVDVSWS